MKKIHYMVNRQPLASAILVIIVCAILMFSTFVVGMSILENQVFAQSIAMFVPSILIIIVLIMLDPLELISLCVTLIILFYISISLESFKEANRIKKDITLRSSSALIDYVESIRETFLNEEVKIAIVVSNTKRLGAKLSAFLELTRTAGFENSELKDKFRAIHREYRNLTTGDCQQ